MGAGNSKEPATAAGPPSSPTPAAASSSSTRNNFSENLSNVAAAGAAAAISTAATSDATTSNNQQQQQQQQSASEDETASSSSSQCPMHNSDGSYSWDLRKAFFGQTKFPHWAGGSKPLSKEEALAATQPKQTADEPAAAASEGGCPVKHEPRWPSSPRSGGGGGGGGCPVKHGNNNNNNMTRHPEYNVYSQPLDPSNQMPSNPNQLPAPTQSKALSTERVASTIPKVSTWCCVGVWDGRGPVARETQVE